MTKGQISPEKEKRMWASAGFDGRKEYPDKHKPGTDWDVVAFVVLYVVWPLLLCAVLLGAITVLAMKLVG